MGIICLSIDLYIMTDEDVRKITDERPSLKELFVFEQEAGRIELFVRIVYWIVIGIIGAIYGMLAWICGFIQWFHILILARRNESLSNFMRGYLEYYVHVFSYLSLMTDIRPDILPVPVRIFEEFPKQ